MNNIICILRTPKTGTYSLIHGLIQSVGLNYLRDTNINIPIGSDFTNPGIIIGHFSFQKFVTSIPINYVFTTRNPINRVLSHILFYRELGFRQKENCASDPFLSLCVNENINNLIQNQLWRQLPEPFNKQAEVSFCNLQTRLLSTNKTFGLKELYLDTTENILDRAIENLSFFSYIVVSNFMNYSWQHFLTKFELPIKHPDVLITRANPTNSKEIGITPLSIKILAELNSVDIQLYNYLLSHLYEINGE